MDRELAVAQTFGRGGPAGADVQHFVEQSIGGGIERLPSRRECRSRRASRLSAIDSAVCAFPVILMTGAMGFPVGVPRPVVNTTTCAPPPTMPVTDSTSRPGVSMTVRPALVMRPGVGDDVGERGPFAPLVRRAERLFLDRRQPAANVPWRGLRAADVEAEGHRLGFHTADNPEELRGRFRRGRARGQQVFGAHDFRNLAEDGGASERPRADPPRVRAPGSRQARRCSPSRRTSRDRIKESRSQGTRCSASSAATSVRLSRCRASSSARFPFALDREDRAGFPRRAPRRPDAAR